MENTLHKYNNMMNDTLSQSTHQMFIDSLDKSWSQKWTDEDISVCKRWISTKNTLKDALLISFVLNRGIVLNTDDYDSLDNFEKELSQYT